MERIAWRRPGCVAWFVFAVIAGLPAVAFVGNNQPVWGLVVFVVIMVGMSKLMKIATMRRIPICPHCGARTDPSFRICRSCRRVKYPQ